MKKNKQRGMTMIELIITLVVIGIIGSVAASKMSSSASLTVAEQAELFANQIRRAQSLAQTWGCQLTMVITTTSYEIRNTVFVPGKTQCATANSVVTDPIDGNNITITLDNGVQFVAASSFDFDIKGVPRDTVSNTILAATTSFTLNGGTNTYIISVSDITGFVSLTGP